MAYVLTPKKDAPPREGKPDGAGDRRPGALSDLPSPDVPKAERRPDALRTNIRSLLRHLRRLVRGPLPPKELILFTSQLAIMVETGTALVASLEGLEAQTTNPRLRRALAAVRRDVKSGQMLSNAMGRHLDVFPETLVSMIAIGESGGFLGTMLERVTVLLTKQAALRSTLRSAFTYPLILAGFCVLVVAFMVVFILPKFTSIFADMEAALPAPTRVLLASVGFLTARWMLLLPAAVILAVGVVIFFRTKRGHRLLDRALVSLPVAGTLIRNIAISRLLRSVGQLMQAGVPLLEALEVSKPFVGNVLFRELVDRMEESVTEGKTLSAPVGECDLVPPTVYQMLLTGESTGALATIMNKVADFYDARASSQAKDLTTILEPLMIFTVGGIVAFVVISLLLPIFRMSSLVH